MSGTTRINDQIPTDPIALIAALLASVLLAKTLTAEEAATFQLAIPTLLTVLPYKRR